MYFTMIFYYELPPYYVWKNGSFAWRNKKEHVADSPGDKKSLFYDRRVYAVHQKHSECYYLRLLLQADRCPTFFQDVKTSNVIYCST